MINIGESVSSGHGKVQQPLCCLAPAQLDEAIGTSPYVIVFIECFQRIQRTLITRRYVGVRETFPLKYITFVNAKIHYRKQIKLVSRLHGHLKLCSSSHGLGQGYGMPLLSSSTLELVSLNPNPYAMVFGDGAYGKEFRDMKPQDQALVMGLVAL